MYFPSFINAVLCVCTHLLMVTRTIQLAAGSEEEECKEMAVSSADVWINQTTSMERTLCQFNFTTALQGLIEGMSMSELEDTRFLLTIVMEPSGFDANANGSLSFIIKQERDIHKVRRLPYVSIWDSESRQIHFGKGLPHWIWNIAATLCIDTTSPYPFSDRELLVSVDSFGAPWPIGFALQLSHQPGMLLRFSPNTKGFDGSGTQTTTTPMLSPSEGIFYRFNLEPQYGDVSQLTIVVNTMEFSGEHPPCTKISVQTQKCPIFDDEVTVDYDGNSVLMLRKGIMFHNVIDEDTEQATECKSLRHEFALALVVLSDDGKCFSGHHGSGGHNLANRAVKYNISIIPRYSDKEYGTPFWSFEWIPLTTLFLFLLAVVFILILAQAILCRIVVNIQEQQPAEKVDGLLYMTDLREMGVKVAKGILFDTCCTNVFYTLGLGMFVVVGVLFSSTSVDGNDCHYNRACAYYVSFPIGSRVVQLNTWNQLVSSFYFTWAGGLLIIVLASRPIILFWTEWTTATFRLMCSLLRNVMIILRLRQANDGYVAAGPPNSPPRLYGMPKWGADLAISFLLALTGLLSAAFHTCPSPRANLFDSPVLDLLILQCWSRACSLRFPYYLKLDWMVVIATVNYIFEIAHTFAHFSHSFCYLSVKVIVAAKLAFFILLGALHVFYIYYRTHYKDEQGKVVHYFRKVVVRWCGDVRGTGIRFFFFWLIDRKVQFLLLFFLLFGNTAYVVYEYKAWLSAEHPTSLDGNHMLQIMEFNIVLVLLAHFGMKFWYEVEYRILGILPCLSFATYIFLTYKFPQGYTYNQLFDESRTLPISQDLGEMCVDNVFDAHDYYHIARATGLFFLCLTLQSLDMTSGGRRLDGILVF